MTKKERVTAAIRGEEVDKIPSGFSLHFPKESAFGDAAVKAHLKFFEESDTDILKIMNENLVPYMGEINHGSDYSMVKEMTMEDGFMQDQVELVKKILAGCGRDAFILGTLHGITASAIHPLEKMDPNYTYDQVREKLCRLLHEDEDTVLAGMKRIADVMCELAGTYIELGVDGVYYAALGGETRFFTDEEFDKWIKPFDLQIMMLPDQGLLLTFSEKDTDFKEGEQLIECLKEMKQVLEKAKERIEVAGASAGSGNSESEPPKQKAIPRPDFAVFAFSKLTDIMSYAASLPANLRIESELYETEGNYFLFLRKGHASYERFSRACVQAMEFGSLYTADEGKTIPIKEHGTCLIDAKAVRKLRG